LKLLSASVRNYRVHRECEVAFDPARTLIGGPNECGKSTLIEAIHRCLFLRAKGTGATHRAMRSELYAGDPEVEVRFEAEGREFALLKRFGSSGEARLTEAGGQTLRGEEAEERTAALLGAKTVGGRGAESQISLQWAHLWIWQGESGADPAPHAEAHRDDLLQRLQDSGGAVARQSDLDAKVAAEAARARDEIFTSGGKPRAGSELERAEQERQSAEEARDAAAERLRSLAQAAAQCEDAERKIREAEASLERLQSQLAEVEAKRQQAGQLRRDCEARKKDLAPIEQRVTDLKLADETIASLGKRRDQLAGEMKPKREALAAARDELTAAREAAEKAEKALAEADEAVREIRLRRDLAAACERTFDCEARAADARRELFRVEKLEREEAAAREALAKLPFIDAKQLKRLRQLDQERAEAAAKVDAMAAAIEVVRADASVRIGDAPVEPGAARTVSETTEVAVGEGTLLRIRPGGGEGLAEARQRLQSLDASLREALEAQGVESAERAGDILARRESHEADRKRLSRDLKELDPERVRKSLAEAEEERQKAVAERDRRRERIPDAKLPQSADEARDGREREEEALRKAEARADEARRERDAASKRRSEREDAARKGEQALQADEASLRETETKLGVELERHGSDQDRAAARKRAEEALAAARRELETGEKALAALQPEQLEEDRSRLARSLDQKKTERESALETRAASRSALSLSGSEDPQASLAAAEARLRAAADRAATVRRRSEALKQERQKLADAFSRPLAERISGYLQCLFGPGARAEVAFEGNAVSGIRLVRPTDPAPMPFARLSGGTREQAAAAVRLAIAELLAADRDGALPVVFDDAFAYSDPERVQTLQRMLDRAARNGLQVVVLTCNPADYDGLGAKAETLPPAPAARPGQTKAAGGGMSDGPIPAADSAPQPSSGPLPQPAREPSSEEPAAPAEAPRETLTAPTPDEEALPVQESDLEARSASAPADASSESAPDPPAQGDREAFLAALAACGGQSGNKALRARLDWSQERYDRVKADLIAAGAIRSGRGRGGSVRLPEAER